jgi:polar amino acid transport system substrate-binding protein
VSRLTGRLAALLLSLALLSPAASVGKEKVTLRADLWCPYTCEPRSDKPGYLIEIAREIFGAHGIEVDYSLMPWKRVLVSLRAGEIDGAVGAGQHEIPGMITPARSLGADVTVLAVPKDLPFVFHGAASLDQLRIGVVTDYSFDDGGDIDAYVHRHIAAKDGKVEQVYGADAQMQNMEKLLNGRIDGIMDDQQVLRFNLMRLSSPPPLRFIVVDARMDSSIAFSPVNPRAQAYADMLSDGIDALRRSGRLKQILHRYGLSDWEKN